MQLLFTCFENFVQVSSSSFTIIYKEFIFFIDADLHKLLIWTPKLRAPSFHIAPE